MTAERKANRRHLSRATCGGLKDEAFASQKHGWEASDTSLPAAVGDLVTLLDLRPDSARRATAAKKRSRQRRPRGRQLR